MLHKLLTRAIVIAGPRNMLVRSVLTRSARQYGATLHFSDATIDVCKDERRIRIAAQHFPFLPDLAEKFEFFFAQLETPGGLLDASSARVHRYMASGLQFELTSLPEELEAIDSYVSVVRPQSGDLVFDIGAYCGVTSHRFSQIVGSSGLVVAFEPDEANYTALVHNIERHRLGNVVPVRAAIAPKSGTYPFNSEAWMGSVLDTATSRAGLTFAPTLVECFSLQDACARWGMPSYIKMDIEGEEIAVLGSSEDLIRRTRIGFAIDTDHRRGKDITALRTEAIFLRCGLETCTIHNPHFVTTWAKPPRTGMS